jgi:hypothetical protein
MHMANSARGSLQACADLFIQDQCVQIRHAAPDEAGYIPAGDQRFGACLKLRVSCRSFSRTGVPEQLNRAVFYSVLHHQTYGLQTRPWRLYLGVYAPSPHIEQMQFSKKGGATCNRDYACL